MAESSSKKRKVNVLESRAPLVGQTNTQNKPTKRQKTAQVESNATLGPESNVPSSTNISADTPALHVGRVAIEDAPAKDPIASPNESRAKRIKAKRNSIREPHEDDDIDAEERQLRAKATVFDPAPRSAFAPWYRDFAAPTPPYEDQQACPIDWSKVTIIHDNPLDCQEAYELRRPWDKEPIAWDKVAEKISLPPADDGKIRNISPEGGRKRFKAANKAVFKLTGVYFPESSLGLGDYGIPLHKELKPTLEALGKAHIAKKRVVARDPLEYDGEAVQLVVFPPDHKGGVNRFITKEVMDRLTIQEEHFFRYSLDNFDRRYNSISQGLCHTLPRRLYRLEPWNDNCYMHLDNGTPSITMSDLFETYRLSQEMGTTRVSDMILDEIILSFKRENELVNKHEKYRATMQDCDATVPPLSFDVDDINLLWEHTESDDPIRRLVLEILYHFVLVVEHESMFDASFVQDWKACMNRPDVERCKVVHGFIHEGKKHRPSDLEKSVARGKNRVTNFAQEKGSLQEFCAKYHNHVRYGFECFRSEPESPKLIPENLDDPRIVRVLFNNVEYKIEDRASHEAVTFNFERMVDEQPDWEWPRIRSVTAYVEGSLDSAFDEGLFCLKPSYYGLDTVGANGRYPSHPGYQLTDWTPPDVEFEQPDVYEEPWEKVIKCDIPISATNYREEKIPIREDEKGEPIYKITAIFFEIEDPNWCPPSNWKSDIDTCDIWPQEVRDYRRWLWVKEGGEIPRIEVKRFRPFEEDAPVGTDPFVDRKTKMSVADILR